MAYKIVATEDFDRQLKHLAKKHFSIPDDYAQLIKDLYRNPRLGDDLGNNTRKVRMAIASKGKGKSGGARVICSTS
jgi:mRNA-degrading endonuclease RelE of RelBE toxin-antitoxin system